MDIQVIFSTIQPVTVTFDRAFPPPSALAIPYDNTLSGLAADNVQGAVDELKEDINLLPPPITEAIGINYDNTLSGLAADNVQGAIDELAKGGGGGGISVNEVNNNNYTILDGDGFTDIILIGLTANRVITLPLTANNDNRIIRFWHGGNGGATFYKITVTRSGADTYENGVDNTSITIPLLTPGDNIQLKADASRSKWDIISAHSGWIKNRGYTYQPGYSGNQDGTKIKREGFHVFFEMNVVGPSPIPSLAHILTLDTDYTAPAGAIETPCYNNSVVTPTIYCTIFMQNQGAVANRIRASGAVTPSGNTAIGLFHWSLK